MNFVKAVYVFGIKFYVTTGGGRYFWPIPYHNSRVLLGNWHFSAGGTHHPLTVAKSTPVLLVFLTKFGYHHPLSQAFWIPVIAPVVEFLPVLSVIRMIFDSS